MRLTLRQLTYFVALAEARNFGRAAARVHVTQPALSMQIRDLEATMQTQLVERRPRDVQLTRAGREVLERARRILAEARELEALGRRQQLTGQINLGVIPTVAPYLLPGALARLRRVASLRDLRVREAPTDALMAALEAGQLDAVVVAEPAALAVRVAEVLFEDRFLLAGTKARLEAAGAEARELSPVALDPDHLLLLDEGHCLADQALEVCALDRRSTRIDLGASSLATLCGLVAQGMGLTFLPEIAIVTEKAAFPTLSLRRFTAPEPARRLALVRRATTTDDGWFTGLAEVLREAGAALTDHARRTVAPSLDIALGPGYVEPERKKGRAR